MPSTSASKHIQSTNPAVAVYYFEQKVFIYGPLLMCLMQAVGVKEDITILYCVCVWGGVFYSFPQEFILRTANATTLIRLLNVTPPHHTRMPRAILSFPSPSTHTGYLSIYTSTYTSVCLPHSQCLSVFMSLSIFLMSSPSVSIHLCKASNILNYQFRF